MDADIIITLLLDRSRGSYLLLLRNTSVWRESKLSSYRFIYSNYKLGMWALISNTFPDSIRSLHDSFTLFTVNDEAGNRIIKFITRLTTVHLIQWYLATQPGEAFLY